MSKTTSISWTDHTFNPWIGCEKVSPGCKNCYAETLDRQRYSKTLDGATQANPIPHWGQGAPRHRTSRETWLQPLRWNRDASRVFCGSLCDWLDDDQVPIEWLADLLGLIARTPHLTWQLLTKRPENWHARMQAVLNLPLEADIDRRSLDLAYPWYRELTPPPNVWFGTSVEDQERAKKRIPKILGIPAQVRFLSCEPLLGALDLSTWLTPALDVHFNGEREALADAKFADAFATMVKTAEKHFFGIHWVIAGGESGSNYREAEIDWFTHLHAQCLAANTAFFMKQDSNRLPGQRGRLPDFLWHNKEFPMQTP